MKKELKKLIQEARDNGENESEMIGTLLNNMLNDNQKVALLAMELFKNGEISSEDKEKFLDTYTMIKNMILDLLLIEK